MSTRAEQKARNLVQRAEALGLTATLAIREEPGTYFDDGEVMLQPRTIVSVDIQDTHLPSIFRSTIHAAWMTRHGGHGARASTCFLTGSYWPSRGKSKKLNARDVDIWVNVLGLSGKRKNDDN